MKNKIYYCEGVLQLFIALGAIISGLMMIITPDESLMKMPLSMLNGSSFISFLLPGIILFLVNGLGHLYSGILCFLKKSKAGFTGIFFGFGLIIWIFIQVSMIGGGHWLQYLYFSLGVVELLLGISFSWR